MLVSLCWGAEPRHTCLSDPAISHCSLKTKRWNKQHKLEINICLDLNWKKFGTLVVVAGDLDSSALKTKADCLTTSEFVFSTKQHEKKLMKATAIKITCNCAVTSCTSFCYVCICNCLLTIFTASSAIIMLWYSGVTNELTVLIQTVLELVHITWLSLCYGSHYWTIKTCCGKGSLFPKRRQRLKILYMHKLW